MQDFVSGQVYAARSLGAPSGVDRLGLAWSPSNTLGLSNGARSGLTGFVAGLARSPKLAAANVTINNLLPGAFDTDRLRATMEGAAKKSGGDESRETSSSQDSGGARRAAATTESDEREGIGQSEQDGHDEQRA